MRRIPFLLLLSGLAGAGAHAREPAPVVASDFAIVPPSSPEEKVGFAEHSRDEIAEADRAVARLVEAARKDGNAQVLQCLASRQTAVRALLGVANGSTDALKTAVAGGEGAKAELEFRKVAVAVSKTRIFLAESQRCVAGGGSGSGSTIVGYASALTQSDELANEAVNTIDLGIDEQVTDFQ
jgi:hypothetical protein